MVKKSDFILRLLILFFIAVLLLTAGWMMRSFPVFIFGGIAPLFAIADYAKTDENFWGSSELILLALTASLFSAHFFSLNFLVASITEAIVLTLAFVAYSVVHQNLGVRPGKFTIIIFWLGVEYIFLKLPFHKSIIFLSDAVQGKPEWLRWNQYTGYLGATFWILICNFFLYLALLKKDQGLKGVFLALTLIFILGPIIISYGSAGAPIKKTEMISLYHEQPLASGNLYSKQGEIIPRVAAIISMAILLLAMVKSKTQKSK